MGHRMHRVLAPLLLLLSCAHAFIPGADGPVSNQEALEGTSTSFYCDSRRPSENDELMLLVWYKNNAPIYSFDARIGSEWSSDVFNTSSRLKIDHHSQPTVLTISNLRDDDQALYHCRVDYLLTPTKNIGVHLSVVVLPSQPFFLDEFGNKVEKKIGPYHEGDTLVLSCLVIGGRPAPRISWFSGEVLVDATDSDSDIPGVRENELYLPLTRDHNSPLTCRASNTHLATPVTAVLEVELYLPAENVSIQLVQGSVRNTLQAGRPAVVQCLARGSYPPPEVSWWLDHRHLTQHSNQSWINETSTAVSFLELSPAVGDNGATLSCVATNVVMAPSRGSMADVIKLNVTYSPLVEVSKIGNGKMNEVLQLDPLHLECEVRANPPVDRIMWYYEDMKINSGAPWPDVNITFNALLIEEATRKNTGRYSCAAGNSVGETRAHQLNVTVLYPPECEDRGIKLVHESLNCTVIALPAPDTFFWHIQATGLEPQHLTTGSSLLPLDQINGPLSDILHISCEAGNGVATQDKPCVKNVNLEHLRPSPPQQCDMAYEYEQFHIRCIPVENATYYEVSVWRMSTSNSSLVLEHRGSMGWGNSGQALAHGAGAPWLVRGALGQLRRGDEAGASACNRYGCSRALLLRPTDTLLYAAAPPWYSFLLEKDVGISIGAVVLVAVFIISTILAVKLSRRPRHKPVAPVLQVLQLDDVAREYLETCSEHKRNVSCGARSCSSGYSGGSLDFEPPAVDRHRKPLYYWDVGPQPDVTLTLHRESAV